MAKLALFGHRHCITVSSLALICAGLLLAGPTITVMSVPIDELVKNDNKVNEHAPSAPEHHDAALVGEPSPPLHVDGGLVEEDEQKAQAEERADHGKDVQKEAVPPSGEQHDGYMEDSNPQTTHIGGKVENGVANGEPPLLDEDAVLYADQEFVDMDGYQPDSEESEGEKEFDEEYQLYLQEMADDMLSNTEMRDKVIEEYKLMMEAVEAGTRSKEKEIEDMYNIAVKMYDHEMRSKLEEQERDILNRQRRGLKEKVHHEEKLDHRANQFDFHDPDAFLWNDEETNHKHMEQIKDIAHKRAQLLHNIDNHRKSAFLDHEMERLLQYRELVRKTSDPVVKQKLIRAHEMEQEALAAATPHEPGKRKQLEELWEKDGFEKDRFDAKLFFKMHDMNEDGAWDLKEVESMVENQAYDIHAKAAKVAGIEEVDKLAVQEEAARMRDHIFKLMDSEDDMVISFEEFMQEAMNKKFNIENPWHAVNPNNEIKDEKLDQFARHAREIQKSKHKNLPKEAIKIAEAKMAKIAARNARINAKMAKKVVKSNDKFRGKKKSAF